MNTIKFYKIKHKVIGLYSKGGGSVHDKPWTSNPIKPKYNHWSKKGKIWQGTGPLRSHLNQYVGYRYGKHADGSTDWNNKVLANEIPDTWIVEEYLPSENVT